MPLTQGLHRAVQRHPEKVALACGGRRGRWRRVPDRVAARAEGPSESNLLFESKP